MKPTTHLRRDKHVFIEFSAMWIFPLEQDRNQTFKIKIIF
jgi:hypothetical protein